MAPSLTRSSYPPESLGSRVSDLPVDHALTLLLSEEPEAALRWSAAALERDPWSPIAILVTSRVLSQMGRARAAIDGLQLGVQRAIDAGDLPLAIVAVDQLRGLGVDVRPALDDIAIAFCRGSGRLHAKPVPPAGEGADFQPLSPLLTGESLAAKATQILIAAKHAESIPGTDLAAVAPLPLFSALSREALREFIDVLETTFVPSGCRLLQEGKDSGAAYIVASGRLEISRRAPEVGSKPRTILGRVGSGALVGEVALMSHLPSAASVTATTAAILLVARRSAVEPIAARHAELGVELAAFCRRHAVANLGWASSLVAAVPAAECANLVERLETKTFERGEKLVAYGEDAQGLHLIVSGEVAVVAREGGGRVMLATRVAGETVGEIEMVLCQKANVDAIAVRSTATLLLPPEEFFALVRESPATLHGLYAIAVRRHHEQRLALEAGSAVANEEFVLEEPDSDPLLGLEAPTAFGSGRSSSIRDAVPSRIPREVSVPTPTPPPVGAYDRGGLESTAYAPQQSGRPAYSSRATPPFPTGGTAPYPMAPSANPARQSTGGAAAPHQGYLPPIPTTAPNAYVPPAPGAPAFTNHPQSAATSASTGGATNTPSSVPAPSPFTPPPAVAARYQTVASARPAQARAAAASSGTSGRRAMTFASAALVMACVFLGVVLFETRGGLSPAPSAGRAPATDPVAPPPAVTEAPIAPTAAAAPPASQAPQATPVTVPAFRARPRPAPTPRAAAPDEATASEGEAPSAPATAAPAAPVSKETKPATTATTAVSSTTDDFGGRQ